jgi:hypothetical protein
MTLDAEEFIRRFLMHVLPDGFQRIRYYGFLGNRYREQKLNWADFGAFPVAMSSGPDIDTLEVSRLMPRYPGQSKGSWKAQWEIVAKSSR